MFQSSRYGTWTRFLVSWMAARVVSKAQQAMGRSVVAAKNYLSYPLAKSQSVKSLAKTKPEEALSEDEMMYERLMAMIFEEVLDFQTYGREVAFKANEDPGAPKPPSKFEFRGPELGGRMSGELLELIGRVLWRWVKGLKQKGFKFDYIASIPNAGDPLADALSRAAADEGVVLNRVWLVKQSTGKRRRIAGVRPGSWNKGARVLLIDDVISHGGSKIEAIRVLRAAGLVPAGLLLVVNREQGGVEELLRMGVQTHAMYRWGALRHRYRFLGLMSHDQCERETDYLRRDREYWLPRRGLLPDDIPKSDFDVVTVSRAMMVHNGCDGGCLACSDCWDDARAVVAALWNHGRLKVSLGAQDPWPRGDWNMWSGQLADDNADVVLAVSQLPRGRGESRLELAKVAVASLRQYSRLTDDRERQTA
jgi:orotate phosphoribosyltransferase